MYRSHDFFGRKPRFRDAAGQSLATAEWDKLLEDIFQGRTTIDDASARLHELQKEYAKAKMTPDLPMPRSSGWLGSLPEKWQRRIERALLFIGKKINERR
jgi:hypothetical protein